MKNQILTLLFLSVINSVSFAQNAVYVDSLGNVVNAKEKAHYYIVGVNESDNTQSVSEYYISGEKRATYKLVPRNDRNQLQWLMDGEYLEWYKSGILRKKIFYKDGRVGTGLCTYWPGGQMKRLEKYGGSGNIVKCYNEEGGEVAYYPYSTPARYPGGDDSLRVFLGRSVKKELMADSVVKKVNVGFRVNRDGTLSNISVVNPQDSVLNREAIRVISAMPKWIPATEDGEAVSAVKTQGITFGKHKIQDTGASIIAERMPSFRNGTTDVDRYFASRMVYPAEAKARRVEGTVIVKFIVDIDGKVIQPRIMKGIGSGCDEEALRLVREMPKWEPGTQNGKPVAVWFVLPIRFVLL